MDLYRADYQVIVKLYVKEYLLQMMIRAYFQTYLDL